MPHCMGVAIFGFFELWDYGTGNSDIVANHSIKLFQVN